jgi:hypothetical protein
MLPDQRYGSTGTIPEGTFANDIAYAIAGPVNIAPDTGVGRKAARLVDALMPVFPFDSPPVRRMLCGLTLIFRGTLLPTAAGAGMLAGSLAGAVRGTIED